MSFDIEDLRRHESPKKRKRTDNESQNEIQDSHSQPAIEHAIVEGRKWNETKRARLAVSSFAEMMLETQTKFRQVFSDDKSGLTAFAELVESRARDPCE